MNNFQENYDKILEVLKTVTKKESFLPQIRKPRLKDKDRYTVKKVKKSN